MILILVYIFYQTNVRDTVALTHDFYQLPLCRLFLCFYTYMSSVYALIITVYILQKHLQAEFSAILLTEIKKKFNLLFQQIIHIHMIYESVCMKYSRC